jgi:hypothetical protein
MDLASDLHASQYADNEPMGKEPIFSNQDSSEDNNLHQKALIFSHLCT